MNPATSSFPVFKVLPNDATSFWEATDGTTWRTLALDLAEMERRQRYRSEGYESTAHYADWELGLEGEVFEELLRVGARLLTLPGIDCAFCDGYLTWEHVVVLTRVAVPDHEAAWLERALDLPLGDLTLLVDRSAEGWAPPLASDGRVGVGGATLGSTGEAVPADSWPWRGPRGREGRTVGTGNGGGTAAERLRRGAATGSWLRRGAPNVRHRSHAPPSTS